MNKILITGFEPFAGELINPSYEAVRHIPDTINGCKIVKACIPTVFKKSINVLNELIIKENPTEVLCIGQAGGRYNISIERVAINLDIARIKDNDGNQPIETPIYNDGDTAYFSNLPINAMLKTLIDNKIPATISNTAGTYVCNHLMYGLLYHIDTKYKHIRGGFIHVPYLPEQTISKSNVPSMSLDYITRALTLCIEAITLNSKDIKYGCGKEI